MKLRVHIVDDDIGVRETLTDALKEQDEWSVTASDFPELTERLSSLRPDLIVLDLVDESDFSTGNSLFEEIRSTWFCPVVVYSAFPDKQSFTHPLVETVTKGANSENEVRDRLSDFVPHAQIIRSVHSEFDSRIREALRDSVSSLVDQIDLPSFRNETALPRSVRRLVAARVDIGESGNGLQAWERFIIPPLGSHLLTADILREKHAAVTDTNAYRLVLTPSCDLVNLRSDAESEVLVGRCEPMNRLGNVELSAGEKLSKKQKDRLKPILTEGLAGNFVPIPAYDGHVPLMVANLKRLELINLEDIRLSSDEGKPEDSSRTFCRVASTDSPFREMVVWAYLRTTGRPGLPSTDVDAWLDNISEHLANLSK